MFLENVFSFALLATQIKTQILLDALRGTNGLQISAANITKLNITTVASVAKEPPSVILAVSVGDGKDLVAGKSTSRFGSAAINSLKIDKTASVAGEPTTDLGNHFKKTLEELLEKIKEQIDHGKEVKAGLFEKVKEIREKLKDLNQDMSAKAKELMEKVKDRLKDWFKKVSDDINRRR